MSGRRSYLRSLSIAGAATAVLFAPPVSASAAPTRQVQLTGTLSVAVGEQPGGHRVKYLLSQGDRLFDLKLDQQQRRSIKPNQRITVRGTRIGASIDVRALSVTRARAATLVSGAHSVLVLRVFWANQDSVTQSAAVNQVGVVDDTLYRENSYNRLGLTASSTPWLQIPQPTTCDDIAAINNSTQAAALTAGIDTSVFAHNMIYISSADCIGRNWGEINGRITWIQGTLNSYRTAHELGHNLGLGHAHSKTCTDAAGTQVAMSETCTSSEYGDSFDFMGYVPPGFGENSPSHLSAPQKDALGWMSGRSLTTDSGTFTLAPTEDQSLSLHAIQLNTPGHTFWLEYRQPLGADAPLASFPGITGGVVIHETEPTTGSWLLDMTPGTSGGFGDAALPAGATWTDPSRYTTVQVNSAGTAGASVTIDPGPARATVPDVVELSKRVAGQQVAAAGLVTHFTGATNDPNAYVATQTPDGGTTVLRGSTVTMLLRQGPVP